MHPFPWFKPPNTPVTDRSGAWWAGGRLQRHRGGYGSGLHARGPGWWCRPRGEGGAQRPVRLPTPAAGADTDVSDAQAVATAAARLTAPHGRLDWVVYCAGHYRRP